jgi:hypothetical protein
LLTGTNLNVFSLLEMLYSYIVMFVRFVNRSLCYIWIRNAYMLYVNKSLYVRFVRSINRSLCYILHSYIVMLGYMLMVGYMLML